MLKWRLSTVRAFGGRDSSPSPQAILLRARTRFVRAYTGTTSPITNVNKEPNASVAVSRFSESHPICRQGAACSFSGSSIGTLGGCPHGRAACIQATHSAIDTLRQYLSSENITSDHPLVYSPATIRSLYCRAESRKQLGMLDFKMFTLLIGMFGSLSIDPRISIVYRVPFASRLLKVSARRTHWAFVLKVGRYKSERGIPFHDSDRFWLMCAELAMVQAKSPSKPLSCDAYGAVLRARTHYHIIRRHSRSPEVHAHYLEALLALQDPRLLDIVACDLSFLLRTHRACHPRLQRILYRLVIRHGGFLSSRSQEAILAALWGRVFQGTNGTFDLSPVNGLSDITLDGCIWDATTMARSFSVTLFGFPGHTPNNKLANSFGPLFSVFSPAYMFSTRWNSLLFFSVFNSSEVPSLDGTLWTIDHALSQVTLCWQVIFGLATVEKVLQELSPAVSIQPTPIEGILETTRNLYHSWLTILKSHPVSRNLACAIAASFLKIAGVLADATLLYDCQDLYCLKNDLEGSRSPVQEFFAVQYLAAVMRVHGPLPDAVLTVVETLPFDSKQQHLVLASVVEVLAPINASLANTLYMAARAKETEPDSEATYTLAVSFARHGALRQAILLLNDGCFSLEQRGVLVSSIARSLRENPRIRHPQSVFVAIVDELTALYHSHTPPEHFQGHLEQLFVALAQHGRGSQLFPVVLSIFRRLPNFFQPRFFVRYCRMLIRHRQSATAGKLLDSISAVYPEIARSLLILTDRAAVQTKAIRVFKRGIPLRGPTSLTVPSRRRRRFRAGLSPERSLQEQFKSGRALVAKHIFDRAAATVSTTRRTTMGNILLHGVSCQLVSRNGRRVRQVLALLENIVQNHGFQPDRVTVNILVNVMTSWRSKFDSPRLRKLFDRFVMSGYPAADYSPLQPPFGTPQTPPSDLPGFSTLSHFVSFEKHLKPLYKKFIKAFYLCNDVEAARKVVGILKVEESKHVIVKEARQRARTSGRNRAAQRNVIPLDITTS